MPSWLNKELLTEFRQQKEAQEVAAQRGGLGGIQQCCPEHSCTGLGKAELTWSWKWWRILRGKKKDFCGCISNKRDKPNQLGKWWACCWMIQATRWQRTAKRLRYPMPQWSDLPSGFPGPWGKWQSLAQWRPLSRVGLDDWCRVLWLGCCDGWLPALQEG